MKLVTPIIARIRDTRRNVRPRFLATIEVLRYEVPRIVYRRNNVQTN